MSATMRISVEATKPELPGDAPMIILRLGEDTYLIGLGGAAMLAEALEKEIQEAKNFDVPAKS